MNGGYVVIESCTIYLTYIVRTIIVCTLALHASCIYKYFSFLMSCPSAVQPSTSCILFAPELKYLMNLWWKFITFLWFITNYAQITDLNLAFGSGPIVFTSTSSLVIPTISLAAHYLCIWAQQCIPSQQPSMYFRKSSHKNIQITMHYCVLQSQCTALQHSR